MKAFLAWLIEVLVNLYEKLFGDEEPIPTVAYEIRIFPGKQGAVRDRPEPPPYPVAWLLAENEAATVGVKDGKLQTVTVKNAEGTFLFYYIAFGEKKRGWILYKADRMELITKIL